MALAPGTIFDAILHKAPTSAVRLNPDCPAELEHIINKALEKDREVRYQSASDMRTDLVRLKRDSDSGRSAAVAAGLPRDVERGGVKPPLRRWAAIALAGVALIAVIAGAAWFHFFRPGARVAGPPMRIVPFTSFPGHQGGARFSPDGNQIAFSWDGEKEDNWDIYVKLIGSEKPLRLTDGAYIVFSSDRLGSIGRLWKVSASGGQPEPLSVGQGGAYSPSLSRDGHRLAYNENG
jgi:hypothetical protein